MNFKNIEVQSDIGWIVESVESKSALPLDEIKIDYSLSGSFLN